MGRFSRGMTALRSSTSMFRSQPSLVLLPLCSLVTVGAAYAALGAALVYYGVLGDLFSSNLLQYGVLFVAFAVSSVAGIFFNAAVVSCAAQYFRGETPTVRDGLREAWSVRWTIAKWGLLSATIGTALVIAEDNVPGVGSVTQSILDLTWAVLTFFIVPVIVVERTDGLRSGLRQSGGAFRRTWGESTTAVVGVGIALLPAGFLGAFLLGYAYFFADGLVAYGSGLVGAILVVACVVVSQVLGMVVRTALYHYATTGEEVGLVGEFDRDDLFVDD